MLHRLGAGIREARRDRGLSIDRTAEAARLSNAEVSRIERGLSAKVPFVTLARLAAVVGLDLSARLYPGAAPVRDAAQLGLLAEFRLGLDRSLRWATEVPLPITGDQRAWDATVGTPTWRYGVEVETAPRDAQALARRLQLKARDGGVDGILLVLPDTRTVREFLGLARTELGALLPVTSRTAMARLGAGLDPGGSSIILLRRGRSAKRTEHHPAPGSVSSPHTPDV